MPKIDETPGKGTYRCQSCGHRIVLEEDTDTIPLCPRCGFDGFTAFPPKRKTDPNATPTA